ncbi:DUF4124 domain-containing protein [Leucothrix sargassi]|nr:DUF4124 domain-containing protein [Leucothrix sargassi]
MTSIKLTALVLILASSAVDASLYRWVDESGKVHFSDKVPPSIAQKGHTSLTKDGIESGVVISAEELKRQHEEKEKSKVEESLKTASMLEEEEQKRKDDILLATYESRGELIRTFNNKLSLIDQSVEISSAREENLARKLARLSKQFKSAKDEVTKMTLSSQIENTESTLSEYRAAISLNKTDKKILSKQYKDTLARFDAITQSNE